MRTCESLRRSLSAGECDQTLASLYALDGADSSLAAARARALRAVRSSKSPLPAEDTAAALFSGPAAPRSAATTPTISTAMCCAAAWIWT